MKEHKTTIFLVGDSTVQSYTKAQAPQTGWGQVLIHFFCREHAYKEYHSPDCPFGEATCYEAEHVRIDNRAIAGRSSRTFLKEGRLNDLLPAMNPGDYLFVQFGHNDAYLKKKERYVSPEKFPDYLMKFADAVKSLQVTLVLISPIVMREYEENGRMPISFPSYRDAMHKLSRKQQIPLIDLGLLTRDYCDSLGPQACKSIFLWVQKGQYPNSSLAEGAQDNAHLQYKGAMEFARLLAFGIKDYKADSQLNDLKELLCL